MRVAVKVAADHPVSGGEDSVFAYKLGRVEDGVHNHLVHTGETIPLDEFVAGLVKQAKAEFPGAEIEVQRLVEDGEDAGRWIPADEFDPEVHRAVGSGSSVTHEVGAPLSAVESGRSRRGARR